MKISKLSALLAAPLAFMAFGGMYHRGHMLTIEFPDGWSAPTTDAEGIATTDGPSGVRCNAQTNESPPMANLTLAMINAEFDHPFDAAEWANLLSVDPANVTVMSGEKRPFADAFFQIATLKMKAGTFGPNEITMRFGVYVLPGRLTMAGCYALTPNFDGWKSTFEATVSSLRPW